MGEATLIIFAGIGFYIWIGILYFLTRKKADPIYQILQSILFAIVTAHLLFAFHFSEPHFFNKQINIFAFPIPLLFGNMALKGDANFLNTILFFGIMGGTITFYYLSKRTTNFYYRFAAACLVFYISCGISGNLAAHLAIHRQAGKQNMECFIQNKSFVESVLNLGISSHAEAEKNSEVYRWSYKNMAFYKTAINPGPSFGCTIKEGKTIRHSAFEDRP